MTARIITDKTALTRAVIRHVQALALSGELEHSVRGYRMGGDAGHPAVLTLDLLVDVDEIAALTCPET
jgi:hypothetical protein